MPSADPSTWGVDFNGYLTTGFAGGVGVLGVAVGGKAELEYDGGAVTASGRWDWGLAGISGTYDWSDVDEDGAGGEDGSVTSVQLSYDNFETSADLSGWNVDPSDYSTGTTIGGSDGSGPVDLDGDGSVDGYDWGGGTVQPVIVDIDGDGIEVSAGSTASFDFDGDGYREAGAWVGKDDGFLVIDRQDDGKTTANPDGTFGDGNITRADELVLSLLTANPDDTDLQALKASWLNNLRGNIDPEVLAGLDPAAQERVFNRFDQGWAHLRVWQDVNQNGETDAGELKTLDDLGITQINLGYDDGSAFSDHDDDITVGLATLQGLGSYVRNGETITGGVGDMELGHEDLGWRRVAVKNADEVVIGYEYQFETGKRWRATDLATQVSKDFDLTALAFDAAQGDDRGNLLTAAGSARAVQISGGQGADTIRGGSSDDVLSGGTGSDQLYGNDGDDLIVADTTDLTSGAVDGGRGFDTLMIENDQGVTVTLLARNLEGAVGGGGADTLSAAGLYEDVRLAGLAGADRLIDGAGDDILSGDDGDDMLLAAAGDDILGGGRGGDDLTAGTGDDQLYGGWGNDTISAGGGDDLAYGDLGADILSGGADDDRLYGGNGNDQLYAGFGDDTLEGGGGNDTLSFWNGDSELWGQAGNDTFRFQQREEHNGANFWGWTAVFGGLGEDELILTGTRAGWSDADGNLNIRHISGNQYQLYRADGSAEKIVIDLVDIERISFAGGGADYVCAAVASDEATGDSYLRREWGAYIGDDSASGMINADGYSGGFYSNGVLSGWMGDDSLQGASVRNSEDVTLENYADTISGGSGSDTVTGLGGNDSLTGSSGQDALNGGDGADTIIGGAGSDQVAGGTGSDSITAATGSDIAWGDAGNDLLYGGSGADVLLGGLNADTLWGGSGADQLSGDAGDDDLFGETGYDKLYGGDGADSLNGGAGSDYLYGGAGNDTLTGDDTLGSGFNYLAGGEGDDLLTGGDYDDQLAGEAGNDTLWGGIGQDILMGGAGADDLYGGDGLTDAISYETSEARVIIDLAPESLTLTGGDALGDQIWGIEQVIGSQLDDQLRGDTLDNMLAGAGGEDFLNGRSGDDDLYGDSGNDTLHGEAGLDRLYGGAGNDLLYGGIVQGDTLDGGAGFDRLDYSFAGEGLVVDLRDSASNAGAALGDLYVDVEHVIGSDTADRLNGQYLANLLEGGDGNDTLNGRNGADTLRGGAGRDLASYIDSLEGVTVRLNFEPTGALKGANGSAEGDLLSSIEDLEGSGHADSLIGNDWANRLSGGAGDDQLQGHAGADTLDGGTGFDMASYTASTTAVTVNLADTSLRSGADALDDAYVSIEGVIGSGFNDRLTGTAADNRLNGGMGADTLNGGDGFDMASYTMSDTGVTVSLANDSLRSGAEALDDVLISIEGLVGSAYGDMLHGDEAANRLNGGAGNDTLRGNGGADSFVFDDDFGSDRIADFQDGSDLIDLRLYGSTDEDRITGLADLQLTTEGADALVLVRGTGDVIRVVGAAGQIGAADFLFATL